MYFVETSALVKAYVTEPGSETVTGAFERFRGSLFTSELVAIETLGTLTRLKRSRTITRGAYRKLRREFEMDLSEIFRIAPIAPDTLTLALELVHDYRNTAANGMDLVHLATLEHLQSLYPPETVYLMCSDRALGNVAAARGVEVFNPETDELG
ncbi:MAG TPA: type II toxin-antitoxin system VapC family toxin [Longimicrobium sp.]|nr:type II toxin-antitoxin system VapC family toxin [Longimicrobium sp.]